MVTRLVLAATIVSLSLHCLVLTGSAEISYRDPISWLSHSAWGKLHTLGLVFFGAAQVALALALKGLDHGRFWLPARAVLTAAGISIFCVAYFFSTTSADVLKSAEVFDPLWIVASCAGLAMGLFQPGFNRLSPLLGRLNLICLIVWCLLIPATLLIGHISLGVYERSVGAVYLAWVAMVSVLAKQTSTNPVGQGAAGR